MSTQSSRGFPKPSGIGKSDDEDYDDVYLEHLIFRLIWHLKNVIYCYYDDDEDDNNDDDRRQDHTDNHNIISKV